MAEKRVDPEDGVTYTYEEIVAHYRAQKYTKREIDDYWQSSCYVKGKRKGKHGEAETKSKQHFKMDSLRAYVQACGSQVHQRILEGKTPSEEQLNAFTFDAVAKLKELAANAPAHVQELVTRPWAPFWNFGKNRPGAEREKLNPSRLLSILKILRESLAQTASSGSVGEIEGSGIPVAKPASSAKGPAWVKQRVWAQKPENGICTWTDGSSMLTEAFELSIEGQRPEVIPAPEEDAALNSKLECNVSPLDLLANLLKVSSVFKTRARASRLKNNGGNSLHPSSRVALPGKRKRKGKRIVELNRDEISSGLDLLRQRCSNFGLNIVDMEDDGNCQFRSVSHQLFHTQDLHLYVRHCAISWLAANADQYQAYFESEDEWMQFLSSMAVNKTWGDEITLRAICEAFHAKVHVMTTEKENWYLNYAPECPDEQRCLKEIFLAYVSPIHYNSIRKAS